MQHDCALNRRAPGYGSVACYGVHLADVHKARLSTPGKKLKADAGMRKHYIIASGHHQRQAQSSWLGTHKISKQEQLKYTPRQLTMHKDQTTQARTQHKCLFSRSNVSIIFRQLDPERLLHKLHTLCVNFSRKRSKQ